jgi:hypothetical protein
MCVCERVREKERQRERETKRKRDKEKERQRERQAGRKRDRGFQPVVSLSLVRIGEVLVFTQKFYFLNKGNKGGQILCE